MSTIMVLVLQIIIVSILFIMINRTIKSSRMLLIIVVLLLPLCDGWWYLRAGGFINMNEIGGNNRVPNNRYLNHDFQELMMTLESDYFFPRLIRNGQEIVFIRQLDKKANENYLYKYSIADHKIIRISDQRVIADSQPIESPDGSIIFSIIKGSHQIGDCTFVKDGLIKQLRPDGVIQELTEGRFPVWLEEGKSFFFYDDVSHNLVLFDIGSKKKKVISRDIKVQSQPIVSPDRKFLLFFEGIPNNFDGLLVSHWRVMTVDGLAKRDVETHDIRIGWDGMQWTY